MPRRSRPPGPPFGVSSDTRIFVALTLAEASALVTQFQLDVHAAALPGLAKIRTALEHATPMVLTPAGPLPPLRAKAYVPRGPKLRMASVDPPRRMATAAIAATPTPAPDDDYVPYRDEAGGVWK